MLLALSPLTVSTSRSFAQVRDNRQLKRNQSQPSKPERRIALVIGNASYKPSPLRNPINDARAMAKALGDLKFDVTLKEDLTQNSMKVAIRQFGAKIREGGVGLFYYAGHGVEVRGENYLIPVDAAPESAEEVEYEAVNAAFVLAQMESAGNGMNIMILDACRDNPFARSFRSASRGLAKMNAPVGTIIAYATAPGSVAIDGGSTGNGMYTLELLRLMRLPGLTIEEVFKRVRIAVSRKTNGKQIPWESTSLMGDFFFTKSGGSAIATPETNVEDEETNQWEKIKDSSKFEDFQAYLRDHPNGKYADLARNRIQSLLWPPPSLPTAEATTISTASFPIRFDGVYRSIDENQISWLRFYKGGIEGFMGGRFVRGVTKVDAAQEVTFWLDRLALGRSGNTPFPGEGRGAFALEGGKLRLSFDDANVLFSVGEITVVNNAKLMLRNNIYDFVKVDAKLGGANVEADSRVVPPVASDSVLKGAYVYIRSSGSLQQFVPRVADRLRRLGAEVDVDFEHSFPGGLGNPIVRKISYKRGQKETARQIARLVKDLVGLGFTERSESDSTEANIFYITLTDKTRF